MSAFMKIGNFFIRLILRSPLHGMMSKNTVLIEVIGWKSGKRIITPVNYTQENSMLRITSQRDRLWWRNLKHNPAARLRLRGKQVKGQATVLESPEAVTAGLTRFLRPAPQLAKYYQIGTNSDGSLNAADLARTAQDAVIIEIKLDQ